MGEVGSSQRPCTLEIEEAQTEYEKAADPSYRPSDDFLAILSGYLERADDAERP